MPDHYWTFQTGSHLNLQTSEKISLRGSKEQELKAVVESFSELLVDKPGLVEDIAHEIDLISSRCKKLKFLLEEGGVMSRIEIACLCRAQWKEGISIPVPVLS